MSDRIFRLCCCVVAVAVLGYFTQLGVNSHVNTGNIATIKTLSQKIAEQGKTIKQQNADKENAISELAAAQAKGAATAAVIGVYAAELAGQLQTICGDFATMAVALNIPLTMCQPLYAVDANGNKINPAPVPPP